MLFTGSGGIQIDWPKTRNGLPWPLEGHRQKSETEGQTFTKKIGERVLPEFVSVYSDPTRERTGGTDLAGHYRIDDEGVRARPVTVVENGVLRNFLMSRSPVKGFAR